VGDRVNEEQSMNLDNSISNETTLYGYIAISASTNRLSHNFNRALKQDAINGMMIPMNIREDDFYFTLLNMKKSHVNGAMLGLEYQENILELLDSSSEMVKECGGCDFVKRIGQTLHGEFISGEVIKEYIKADLSIKKIAIIGDGALARSLAILLKEYELFFYDTQIEKLLLVSEALHVNIDINYLAPSGIDFSGYDLLIDTTNQEISSAIIKPAKMNLDIKDAKNFSNLKQFANYIGFDNLLDFYTLHLIEDSKQ
jgi:shikimate 5-dehydrogenase